MKLKTSVIIPVYNGGQFIARAIESVLAQTCPAAEIIVINDGSKDNTLAVLKQFEGRIIYKTIKNGGASRARNEGVAMATGELVAFLDADDIWHASKLEKQTALFEKYPEAGFSCCNFRLHDAELGRDADHFRILSKLKVNYNEPLSLELIKLLFLMNFVGTSSTVVLRKNVLDQVGPFNTAYKQAEDYELWLRCAMVTKFIVASEVLVDKKTHSTNLTNNQIEMQAFHKMVLRDFMSINSYFLKKKNLYTDCLAALSRTNYKLGDLNFNAGHLKESWRCYWQSFFCYKSWRTFARFAGGVSKKITRLLTGGLISRKMLRRLRLTFRF